MRTRSDAISVAKGWRSGAKPFNFNGMCLKIVRTALGINSRFPSAEAAWYGTAKEDRVAFDGDYDSVPRGVCFFWTNGRHGHIVLTLGNGKCLTNDFHGAGRYTVARLADITRGWGQKPQGWTKTLNGVRYYTAPRGDWYHVRTPWANFREAPDARAKVLTRKKRGDNFYIVGTRQVGKRTWGRLESGKWVNLTVMKKGKK